MMAQEALPAGKNLRELLSGLVEAPAGVTVTDITLDSRQASEGGAFLACRGLSSHGLQYVERAVTARVAAVIWEPAPGVSAPQLPPHILTLAVPDLGRHLGLIANRFFDSPSRRLRIAGVTGTNGKTTSCWLLAQALEIIGHRSAYAGTLGYGTASTLKPATHTTPDCISVHRMLAELAGRGIRDLGMEVSSHALAQNRVDGVRVHTAVFTNLTRDHLDFHRTMEAYAEAKLRLFAFPELEQQVINMGDPTGRRMAEQVSGAVPLTAVWSGPGDYRDVADQFVHARSAHAASDGLEVEVQSSWGNGRIRSRLLGEFNAENLVSVLAVLLLWDVPFAQALRALEMTNAPAGRMEAFRGAGPLAVVDYAHSPDALGKALRAARRHCRGRLWCVFGCGGDRDPGKRPMMGAVAAERADEIILTDDNPRTESSQRIIDAILEGMSGREGVRVIPERARAIATALREAARDDVVLIAGKGHEEYQIYGTSALPFSDREEVRKLLGVSA